jgi:hypothetical protein
MMTIEQMEATVKQLQAEIEKMKVEQLNKEWPQIDDDCYLVTHAGDVEFLLYDAGAFDAGCFATGNAFKAKSEAEMEIEARKVAVLLNRKPGCRKHKEWSHQLYLNADDDAVGTLHSNNAYSWRGIYFDTRENIELAIKVVGEPRILAAMRWDVYGEVKE